MDIRKFDVFPKLANEYRIGTISGGILSLISVFAAIVLCFYEVAAYLNAPTRQFLFVDTRRPTGPDGVTIDQNSQPRLDVKVSVTFPKAPCFLIHLDVIDSVTQLAMPLENINSKFMRLDSQGKPIEALDLSTLVNTTVQEKCGSCYNAKDPKRICCRSCQEVFDAYRDAAFKPPVLTEIEQCKPVAEKVAKMEGEGCKVDASFKALRVASEMHIAPGYSWNSEGWHVHDLSLFTKEFASLNLTHTIHYLSFSEKEGDYPLNNLNNVQTENGAWRVVYTADILEGNYSASKYQMYNPKSFASGLFFKYDVSPISAVTYTDSEPVFHLLTRILTVLGGVLGLCRLIDAITFHTRRMKRTEEIK
ncbi:hypothetical protein TVAG_317730 [Trichomonas vaginalis G3]|uniref:Uncharacterized protein n=1 Tax=Trichomonas vaginalis (strain ATCC PRA-98 / G3) TaxID=412133 RepID=A2F3M0_TRIV3|nr:vesicle-mediated transport [Trichomonas vaginalis G3]EAY00488.1 hypothetical protein TVAG_317730 [Trichomonas vaginalis G3]KAI5520554.1 vesicle-mediated transport [Trichomonas vaginalis G3]|eukprot:XP_001313417.1 hypothetical protein [Trichomonas vaginalis G3]